MYKRYVTYCNMFDWWYTYAHTGMYDLCGIHTHTEEVKKDPVSWTTREACNIDGSWKIDRRKERKKLKNAPLGCNYLTGETGPVKTSPSIARRASARISNVNMSKTLSASSLVAFAFPLPLELSLSVTAARSQTHKQDLPSSLFYFLFCCDPCLTVFFFYFSTVKE